MYAIYYQGYSKRIALSCNGGLGCFIITLFSSDVYVFAIENHDAETVADFFSGVIFRSFSKYHIPIDAKFDADFKNV